MKVSRRIQKLLDSLRKADHYLTTLYIESIYGASDEVITDAELTIMDRVCKGMNPESEAGLMEVHDIIGEIAAERETKIQDTDDCIDTLIVMSRERAYNIVSACRSNGYPYTSRLHDVYTANLDNSREFSAVALALDCVNLTHTVLKELR